LIIVKKGHVNDQDRERSVEYTSTTELSNLTASGGEYARCSVQRKMKEIKFDKVV
jgi:hypothetical protein